MTPSVPWAPAALCLVLCCCTPGAATRAGARVRLRAPDVAVALAGARPARFGAQAQASGNASAAEANRTFANNSQAPEASDASAVGKSGRDHVQALAAQSRSSSAAAQPTHKLRICNAYPDRGAIDVFHGDARLTSAPMEYKECHEFASPMKVGDKLRFEVDGVRAGHFAVSDLPEGDAVLVLVVFRRDIMSQAVAFESHVFANLINAQIAVLDAYRGPSGAGTTPAIRDPSGASKPGGARMESLHYDSVVAVNPGVYEVVLQGPDGRVKTRRELVALNRESYIVVRCGVEPRAGGQAYPQELIVFPHSDAKVLIGSGSWSPRGASFLATGVAVLAAAVSTAW
ncbi:unnamed protein product [Prorocentrum cordatum]|uniref:DUF4397 domain-containing protein n=1 Tax=Prorocentrum cordatum TaxID=2364126 RepID=A0ABN9U1H0_9DINO|nr:unnamed protein product [Polarella glacialis]